MTKRRTRFAISLMLAVPVLLLTAACGTLEVGIEVPPRVMEAVTIAPETATQGVTSAPQSVPTAAPEIPTTPTPVPESYALPTTEPPSTPMPLDQYQAPTSLRVAFVDGSNVWLWTAEDRSATPLTHMGGASGDVRLSDDATMVAYLRGEELWIVNTAERTERPLIATEDLDALGPAGASVALHRFEWAPSTHIVAFNTRLRASVGLHLNDDLHLVDADTQQCTVLLPAGEGGEFYYSPNGSQLAVITAGDVSLVDADGSNRQDGVLTYTPIATHSQYRYYVYPAWAADGTAVRVAIPPANPLARPVQYTSLWHIPIDGTPARLVASVEAAPSAGQNPVEFFSDLTYAAYLQIRHPESVSAGPTQVWLEVRSLESGGIIAYPDVVGFLGWAPAQKRFAFVSGRESPQLQIGQWSGATLAGSIEAGIPVPSFRWVDADHYLFLARRNSEAGADRDGWELILGEVGGSSTILATTSHYLSYDFAQVPPQDAAVPSSQLQHLCASIESASTWPQGASDVSRWPVVTNQELGVEFRYPDGWRLESFDDWVGVGPQHIGEDLVWGVHHFDASKTGIEDIIAGIGNQFGSDRAETRECVSLGGWMAVRVIVTTPRIDDWYAESVILEHGASIIQITNGAVRDDRFATFCASFRFDPPGAEPDDQHSSSSATEPAANPTPGSAATDRPATAVPTTTSLPVGGTLQLAEPLLIDGEAGLIFASGQIDATRKTVKLSAKDGTLLDAYEHTGKLALDPTRGRLFVDQGEAGIAVLDAGTGDSLAVVTLPLIGPARATPQVDPSSGLLYTFRGNNVCVLDPISLDVVRTATMVVPTSVCGDPGQDAIISASFYDDATDRMYLVFVTYVCTPWVQQTIVAYDANTLLELGRYQTERTFQAVAYAGNLHGTTTSQLGRSVSWAWDGSEAWHETGDDGRLLGGIILDERRRLIYEALDGQVWVWRPRPREVISRADEALLSSGARLVACDPVSDQLYFLLDGQLEILPASAIAVE